MTTVNTMSLKSGEEAFNPKRIAFGNYTTVLAATCGNLPLNPW